MSPQTHDLMLRVAQAVRMAASTAARGRAADLERGDFMKEAGCYNSAANAVNKLDLEAIVNQVGEIAPNLSARKAFDQAAVSAGFNAHRRDDSSLLHPSTERAEKVWLAGVRWGRQHHG